jgi:phosphopantothenoylcysteine decarboxylase/phosphopantothenate--cysteine ligase
VKRIDVVSAGDMAGAVQRECASDVLIMCAAVADWRPRDVAPEKRKKTEGVWTPELERTEDILLEASRSAARPKVVVGFAAETSNVEENARAKLVAKALDGVVANAVGGEQGFGSEDNQVLLIARDGSSRSVGPAPKREVADEIVAWVAAMLRDGT